MWGNVFSERPEAVKCSNFVGGHYVFLKCEFCAEATEMPGANSLVEGARRKPLDFVRLFVLFNLGNILALLDKVMVSEVCMTPYHVIRA